MYNAPCEKVFDLYRRLLEIHIATKTSDTTFHKDSAAFYESAFDFFHSVMEGMTDAGKAASMDSAAAKKETASILNELKKIAEDMVNNNDDIAIDNILRGVVEDLGFQVGTMKGILGTGSEPENGPAYEHKEDKFADEKPEDEEEKTDTQKEDTSYDWQEVDYSTDIEDSEDDESEFTDEYDDSHWYSYKWDKKRKQKPAGFEMHIMWE